MTTTMNHSNCDHPATKAGRAKCRRVHAAAETARIALLTETLAGYYDNSLDIEEIAARFLTCAPEAAKAYYEGDLDIDSVIALANS